ncbi:MAG: hypothetical protein KatS3mg057_0683 [Herpetosiphonaceae bacterium]|nr:MAG: hypothetical protein KatS3mg057_0683 [Herpetosiphonaceae bacterium]
MVEGYVDVLAAHQAGFRHVVAPMGTALSDSHVRVLSKLTRRIYLALDADAAGQTATLKGLQTLQENLETRTIPVPTSEGLRWERELDAEVRILSLPAGRDPDEVIRESPQAWGRMVEEAQPLMDFYLRALTADLDLQSAKGKATAVERLVPLLAQIGDPIEQAHYIQQLAARIGMDEMLVRSQVMAARRGRSAPQPRPLPATASDRQREDYLLSLLLRYPAHRATLEQELAAEIAQKPQLGTLLNGRIVELFESTENQQVWLAFERALADESAKDGSWVAALPPELQQHVEELLRRHQEPPIPPYRVGSTLISCAQPLRLRLMRRWFNRLAEVIRSAADEEQDSLLAQPNELLEHLHRLSRPPRSSYYRDLRDLPGL